MAVCAVSTVSCNLPAYSLATPRCMQLLDVLIRPTESTDVRLRRFHKLSSIQTAIDVNLVVTVHTCSTFDNK